MLLLQVMEIRVLHLRIPVRNINHRITNNYHNLQTLIDSDPARILPQETASSGLAPESEPSNS